MSGDPALNLHVVRNAGSDRTHVMHVTGTTTAVLLGHEYQRPQRDKAACGALIADGVLMQAGTKVRCYPCRHVTGITEEP